MDFAPLNEALASHSYDKVADICDNLSLSAAARGEGSNDRWPYTIHLLGHMYANDVNSARFLWKSIPSAVKENNPELMAVWKIGQNLWTRDYAAVYQAIHDFSWSPDVQVMVTTFSDIYKKRMFYLISLAYSTISVQDATVFLGMNEEDVTKYATEHGWLVDEDAKMLIVKKKAIMIKHKLNSTKLQRLTEYVHHLEH